MGGLPIHDMPALALRTTWRGRQHGHQAALGDLPAGGGHPGVPEERVLADLHLVDPEPAAAELVATEQGVVGEERAVVDRGELGDQQHRGGLDLVADVGPQRPQPAAASRCWHRAGRASPAPRRAAAGWTTPARPGGRAPGGGRVRDRSPHSRTPATTRSASTPSPTTVARGSTATAVRKASPTDVVSRSHGDTTSRPQSAATSGRSEMTTAEAAYAPIQRAWFSRCGVRPRTAGDGGANRGCARPVLTGRHLAEDGASRRPPRPSRR